MVVGFGAKIVKMKKARRVAGLHPLTKTT